MSFPMEDDIDAEELKAAQELRQALISEELLPSKHDDTHMMLRLHILCLIAINIDLWCLSCYYPVMNRLFVIFLYDGADF